MIHGQIKNVYNDYLAFLKSLGIDAEFREGQVAFISHAVLPYYFNDKGFSVLAEGQTGTGKTLGYLFPLVINRMIESKQLPELSNIPQFLLNSNSIEEGLFLEEKTKDELISEKMFSGEVNEDLYKTVSFNSPDKVFIVVYTKALQDQIINEINNKINPYLQSKGLNIIKASKIIGKTNYLCSENFIKIKEEINKYKQELSNIRMQMLYSENDLDRKIATEIISEVENAEKYIDEIISEGIYDIDGLKSKYKGQWESVIETIENVSKTSLFAPGFTIDSKSGKLTSSCLECGKTDCPRRADLDILVNSDVVVMNYHSFFYFMRMLSMYSNKMEKGLKELEAEKDVWEDKYDLKIDIDKPYTRSDISTLMPKEEQDKFLEFQKKYKTTILARKINMFGKDVNIKNLMFIFDEAHKFEKILIDFYSEQLNIKEDILKPFEIFVKKAESPILKINQGSLVDVKDIDYIRKNLGSNFDVLHSFYHDLKSSIDKIFEFIKNMDTTQEHGDIFTLENISRVFFNLPMVKTRIIDKLYGQKKGDELWKEIEKIKDKEGTEYDLGLLLHFNNILQEIEHVFTRIKDVYDKVKKDDSYDWLIKSYPFKKALLLHQNLEKLIKYNDIYLNHRINDLEHKVKTYQYKFKSYEESNYFKNLKEIFNDIIFIRTKIKPYYNHMIKYNDVTISETDILKIPKQKMDNLLNNIFMNSWNVTKTIFTSATMPDFESFKHSLNIKNSVEVIVESSFDYEKNSMIYVPEDVPLVMKDGIVNRMWLEYLENNLERYIFALKGGVFILTTSNDMHHRIYNFIKNNAENWEKKYGLKLTLFNMFTKKKDVLNNFGICDVDKEKHIGVFGKEYFQGIDMVKDRLTTLIIPKLPFDEPTSPYKKVKEADEEQKILKQLLKKYGYPTDKNKVLQLVNKAKYETFKKVSLTNTCDETRQGIGRLIRTEEDAGIVIILDSRFIKYYSYFKNKLPHKITTKEQELGNFIDNVQKGALVLSNTFKTDEKISKILERKLTKEVKETIKK